MYICLEHAIQFSSSLTPTVAYSMSGSGGKGEKLVVLQANHCVSYILFSFSQPNKED